MDLTLRAYLDAKIDPIAEDVREIRHQLTIQNGRLRRVEQRVAVLWFVLAAIVAGGGVILQAFIR